MTQLAKGFGFDLANTFPGDGESLADFLEGVFAAIVEAEAHFDDALLARSEGAEHGSNLLFEVKVDDRFRRRDNCLIFDEIAEVSFFFFTDGSFEGDGLLGNFLGLAHEFDGNIHALGDFIGGRLAAEFLNHLAAGADLLVDGFDHVDGDADGARLVRDGAGDGLANPPGSVGGELVAATPFKFVRTTHEADVAFLDEIEELQAAVGVFLGDGDDQTKVGFGQFALGLLGVRFPPKDDGEGALEAGGSDLVGFLKLGALQFAGAEILAGRDSCFAAGDDGAAFQGNDFLVEGMKALNGVAHDFDETLFFTLVKFDGANQAGHLNAGAGELVPGAKIDALVGAGHGLEMRGLLQAGGVKDFNLVDNAKGLLGFFGNFIFGEFFVVKMDNFLDGLIAVAKFDGNGEEFLQDQRRAGDGFENAEVAAFDALGDGDFVLAGEQGDDTHFAEVNANGVVGFFGRAGRVVEFGLIAVNGFDANFDFARFDDFEGGAAGFGGGEILVDVDAVTLNGGESTIDFFRSVILDGEQVVDFVDQQIAAFLAKGKKRTELIVFFLKQQ